MGGIFQGGISHSLFGALIVLALVYLAFRLLRSMKSNERSSFRDRIDSLEILKGRFAKGELSEEEYTKMKRVLLES